MLHWFVLSIVQAYIRASTLNQTWANCIAQAYIHVNACNQSDPKRSTKHNFVCSLVPLLYLTPGSSTEKRRATLMILAAFGNCIVSHKMQLSYIAPATVRQLKKEFTEASGGKKPKRFLEFSTRILVRGKWNFVFTSVEEYLQQQ